MAVGEYPFVGTILVGNTFVGVTFVGTTFVGVTFIGTTFVGEILPTEEICSPEVSWLAAGASSVVTADAAGVSTSKVQ